MSQQPSHVSVSHIPNLKTLRRGGLRGRGRGSGSQEGWTPDQSRQNKDDIIRNTDNDAATSRLSAVEAGYLSDTFVGLFSTSDESPRRLPLMNRGTYVRTTAIDRIIETFISSQPATARLQIISLGAGSDTRYFRFRQRYTGLDLVYHELDFEANTRRKIAHLRKSPSITKIKQLCNLDLSTSSTDVKVIDNDTRLVSSTYNIHPIDLRILKATSSPLTQIDKTLPTLLISECCLCYLSPDDADDVLSYFRHLFSPTVPLAIVIYEPIKPNDSFGRTMVMNLTARGIALQTLEKYADLQEQRARLIDHGFRGASDGRNHDYLSGEGQRTGGAQAADVDFIWKHWVDEKENERVEGLEWMDEVEEFVLLARHYCVAWGWRGFAEDKGWRNLPASS